MNNKDKSIEKTKKMMQVMQAYIEGKEVQSQSKGFTGWGEVNEIGFMRHQWDSRNENYRVLEKGKVVLEVGVEFDDQLSVEDHEQLQKNAVTEAIKLVTGDNEKNMWPHYCVKENGTLYTNNGSSCNSCGEIKPKLGTRH